MLLESFLGIIIVSIKVWRVSSMLFFPLFLFLILILNLLIALNLIVTRLSTSSHSTTSPSSSSSHHLILIIVVVEHEHHSVQASTHLFLSISALHVASSQCGHLILSISCAVLIGVP